MIVCLLLRILVWADNSPTSAIPCLGIVSGKKKKPPLNLLFVNRYCLTVNLLLTVQGAVCFPKLGTVIVKISTEYT